MHPKLHITKRKLPSGSKIGFAVVDLNKSDRYPMNFLCGLPSVRGSVLKNASRYPFFLFFGKRSFEVAETLLADALKNESDPEVKTEIKRRLKLLGTESRSSLASVR